MAIDRRGTQRLTTKIRDDLVRRIRDGEFAVGDKIPSLKALCSHYDAAELTVHLAIRDLQQRRVLESATGRGTFVLRVPDDSSEADAADELVQLRSDVDALTKRVRRLEDASRGE